MTRPGKVPDLPLSWRTPRRLTTEAFFFFFFFYVPQLDLWGSPFWVRFLRIWPIFNQTVEVVTFRLRGWWVRIFESVRWNVCVHRLDFGLYSHPKEFRGENGVRTHVNSKGKKPSTGKKFSSEEDRTHDAASSEPNILPTSCSGIKAGLKGDWSWGRGGGGGWGECGGGGGVDQ